MFIFLMFAGIIAWALCIAFLLDAQFSKKEKMMWVVGCLVLTLIIVGVRLGQLAYTKGYQYYDFERSGLCIEFQKLACNDIPFGVDECRLIRAEVRCVSQPEWWGNAYQPYIKEN